MGKDSLYYKNKKKELRKKYVTEQRNHMENSLPFNKVMFQKLFDYLLHCV